MMRECSTFCNVARKTSDTNTLFPRCYTVCHDNSIDSLSGLFEIGYFEECISFYDAFCLEHDWEHAFDIPAAQINDYFYKHQHQKMFQHARTFAAVIGSYLALNDYEKAYQLYKEMDFWGVVPLRETFYHFIDVKERIGSDV